MSNNEQENFRYGHVFGASVAEIDIQDLIDKQVEKGEPIALTMPKNITAETRRVLGRLGNDIISKGAKIVLIDNNSAEE